MAPEWWRHSPGFGIATGGNWLANELISRRATTIGDNPKWTSSRWPGRCISATRIAAATRFTLEGVEIPTMSIEHLIASKRTGRMQDAVDIDSA